MYKIILIDDDLKELEKVRRTIKENEPEDFSFSKGDYCFSSYNIGDYGSESDIITKILDEIYNKDVSLYIIDYKILTANAFYKGNEIFYEVCKKVPNFPIIVLTERVGESKEGGFVDADKIYEKTKFFKLESDYSKEKVANLFANMKRYKNNLENTECMLNEYIGEMQNYGVSPELIQKITTVEVELAKLLPFQISQAEKIYDPSKLKEVVVLLNEAKKLIDDEE